MQSKREYQFTMKKAAFPESIKKLFTCVRGESYFISAFGEIGVPFPHVIGTPFVCTPTPSDHSK